MFNNSQQSGEIIQGPKELEAKKKSLLIEIEELGKQHFSTGLAYEEISDKLKEIELRASKIKDNKVEFESLNKTKKQLETNLLELVTKIEEKDKVLFSLEKDQSYKIAEFNSLMSDKEEELTNILSSRQEDIGAIEKRLSSKTTELEDLNTECDIVKEKKADFETDITALKEDVTALEKTNEKVLELKVEEDSKKKRLASLEVLEISLKKKVVDCQTELLSISSKVAKENKEADEFIKNGKEIRAKFDNDMTEERAIMDKREGIVSEKEEWLESSRDSLRKAKAELEKFYKRKINHLNI